MAITRACCDVIVDACRRNGVHFEVAENYFRMPKQRAIIDLIDKGILGDIVRVYFVEAKAQNPFEPTVTHRGLTRPLSKFGKLFRDVHGHGVAPAVTASPVRAKRTPPDFGDGQTPTGRAPSSSTRTGRMP